MTTKTKPSPRRTAPAPDDGDELAVLLTAVHNQLHHPDRDCRLDGRGCCDTIARHQP